MPRAVERLCFFIPGFMQDRSQTNQGLTLLEHEFIDEFEMNGLACIDFAEWNSDWNAQAEHIARLMMEATNPRLMIVGYSWGGGFGFTRFANKLRDRGVTIHAAILSDAVYHWGPRCCHTPLGLYAAQIKAYYPYLHCTQKLIDWHCLPPRPRITVPDNVLMVESFYQENSRLRGHELVCDSPNTILHRTKINLRNHTSMDECPEFRQKCKDIAKEFFPPAPKVIRQKRTPKGKL